MSDGNRNRNGYIIESSAWFKHPEYVEDFLNTGSVLWNHDSDKPIGRPLSFYKRQDNKVGVSGYVFDDVHTNGAIGRKLVLGLSTGHGRDTMEVVFRNKEGDEKTEEEYWKLPWSEIMSDNWTMVVTNAEITEFSFTPTRSNRASVLSNKIERYAEHFKKDPTEVERLFSNHLQMNKTAQMKNEGDPEVPETVVPPETPAPVAPEAPASPETPPAPTEENKITPAPTEAEVLQNKITALETSHAQEIETLKNNLQSEYEVKLTTEINKVREEERTNLAKVVGGTNAATDVKTPEDFRQKHFKS